LNRGKLLAALHHFVGEYSEHWLKPFRDNEGGVATAVASLLPAGAERRWSHQVCMVSDRNESTC